MTDESGRVREKELTEAMEVMARAVGGHAVFKYKYGNLRVELPKLPASDEHTKALYVFAELIEEATAATGAE